MFSSFSAILKHFITKYRGYNSSHSILKTSWFLGSSSAPRLAPKNLGGPSCKKKYSRCILQIFKALPSNISFYICSKRRMAKIFLFCFYCLNAPIASAIKSSNEYQIPLAVNQAPNHQLRKAIYTCIFNHIVPLFVLFLPLQ